MKPTFVNLRALWANKDFNNALIMVDDLLREVGEDPHLLVKKADLIQLTEVEKYTLDDAEKCYLKAHQLDPEDIGIIFEIICFYDSVKIDFTEVDKFEKLFKKIASEKIDHLNKILGKR